MSLLDEFEKLQTPQTATPGVGTSPPATGRSLLQEFEAQQGGTPPTADPELPETGISLSRAWNELKRGTLQIKGGLEANIAAAPSDNVFGIPVGEGFRQTAEKGKEKALQAAVMTTAQADAIPMRPALKEISEATGASDWGKAWDAFMKDPFGVMTDAFAQSAPTALGTVVGGVLGRVPGMVAGTFLTSGATEFLTGVMDNLQEEGVDIKNPEALRTALANPELMARVRRSSAIKAGVVASFDASTAGIAGKTIAPAALKSQVARQAVNLPTQAVIQSAGGMGGEALGSVAAGQPIRPGAVLLEGIGEIPGTAIDVATAKYASRPTGTRGNNPGNLISGTNPDGTLRFQTFNSPEEGVAGLIRNVQSYPAWFNKGQPMTIRQIAYKAGPPDDGKNPALKGNNPDLWAKVVAGSMGIDPDDVLDMGNPAVMAAFARGVHTIEHGGSKVFSDDVYTNGAALAAGGQPIARGTSTSTAPPAEDPALTMARKDRSLSLTDEDLEKDHDLPIDDALAAFGETEVAATEQSGDVAETISAAKPPASSGAPPTGEAVPGAAPPGTVASGGLPAATPSSTPAAAPMGAATTLDIQERLNQLRKDITTAQSANDIEAVRRLTAEAKALQQQDIADKAWAARSAPARAGDSPLLQTVRHVQREMAAAGLDPETLTRANVYRLAPEVEAATALGTDALERDLARREVAKSFVEDLARRTDPRAKRQFGRSKEAIETLINTPNPNNSLALENLPVAVSERQGQVGRRLRQTALAQGEVIGVGVPTEHYPADYFRDTVATVKQLLQVFAPRARVIVTSLTRGMAAAQSFMRDLDPKSNLYLINPRNATRIDKVPGEYNSTTRAQIMYGVAHEVGHVMVEEHFLGDLAEDLQIALRKIGTNDPFEQVPESLLAQLPPERAAILREFNEKKARLLGPKSKATFGDFLNEWASPQVFVQGLGTMKDYSAHWWADMYFGEGAWNRSAKSMVRAWHDDWPVGTIHEYLAEQAARYAHSARLLQNTALGRSEWFKTLWAQLKTLFTVLKQMGMVPRVSPGRQFEKWVKTLAAKPTNRKGATKVTLGGGEQRFEGGEPQIEPSIDDWTLVQGMDLPSDADRQLLHSVLTNPRLDAKSTLEGLADQYEGDFALIAKRVASVLPAGIPLIERYAFQHNFGVPPTPTFTQNVGWYWPGGASYETKGVTVEEHIAINSDYASEPLRTLLHEATHAVTARVMRALAAMKDPRARVMDSVLSAIRAPMLIHENARVQYAAKNVRELVAEAFSSKEVQDYLKTVELPPAVSAEISQLVGQLAPEGVTAWDAFVAWVRSILNLPPTVHTALEAVLSLGNEFMRVQQRSYQKASYDATQFNILPEAEHHETASDAQKAMFQFNVPSDVRAEASEMFARGQTEAAKEWIELHAPGEIRWASPGPQGSVPSSTPSIQAHIAQMAKAQPLGMRAWYRSGMRRLGEAMDIFVNVREATFRDPLNRGAQHIDMVHTRFRSQVGAYEKQATERVTALASSLSIKQQRRLFDFLRREWEGGANWTVIATNPVTKRWEHTAGPKWVAEAQTSSLTQEEAQIALNMKNEYLYRQGELHRVLRDLLVEKQNEAMARGRLASVAYYAKQIKDLAKGFQTLRNTPFMAQTRFGEFILEVRDRQGKVIHVENYETKELRARARERLEEAKATTAGMRFAEYSVDPTSSILRVLPTDVLSHTTNHFGLTPRQRANLLKMQEPLTRRAATRKYSMPLAKISGHSRDQLRVFADFMHNDALVLSKLMYANQFRAGLRMMEEDIMAANAAGDSGRVAELEHAHKWFRAAVRQIVNPAQEWHLARSLIVLKQLGFSVKTAVANFSTLVNTWALATSRLGTLRGSKKMAGAMKDLAANRIEIATNKVLNSPMQGLSTLTVDERQALEIAQQRGLLRETYAADMALIQNGNLLDRLNLAHTVNAQEWISKWYRKTVNGSMLMQRMVEETVRRVTFLTMFRIYREQGMQAFAPIGLGPNAPVPPNAFDAAYNDVNMTQGDNVIQARAPVMRGRANIALLYFNFMRNMMWQMFGGYTRGRKAREAAGMLPQSKGWGSEWVRMWLVYLFLGGLMGLPFAEDLDKIAEAIAEKFFGARFSLKEHAYQLANWLSDNASSLGVDIAPRSIVHGNLSDFDFGLGRVDISGSISLGNTVPGMGGVDRLGEDGTRFFTALFGPAGRVAQEMFDVWNNKLPPERRWAFFIPTAGQNLLKGFEPEPRYFTGARIAVDPTTGVIRELATGEMLAQMMGFSPQIVSANREVYGMQTDLRMYWQERRNGLLKALFEAKLSGEQDAVHDVLQRLRDFNAEAPRGMALSAESVQQSLRQRQKRVLTQEATGTPREPKGLRQELGDVRRLVLPGGR